MIFLCKEPTFNFYLVNLFIMFTVRRKTRPVLMAYVCVSAHASLSLSAKWLRSWASARASPVSYKMCFFFLSRDIDIVYKLRVFCVWNLSFIRLYVNVSVDGGGMLGRSVSKVKLLSLCLMYH